MQFRQSANVRQLSSRSIRIGDRSVRTTYPIDHLVAVADRLVLAVEQKGDSWFYQCFAIDPRLAMNRGQPPAFTATVNVGTNIMLPATHNRAIVMPTGLEVDMPGSVLNLVETSGGFVVVVDPFDVPIDNALFIERDSRIRWQVQPNSFTGLRTAGGYNGATRDSLEQPYLGLDRAGLFAVDITNGRIVRHVWSVP
jgi:hypothetical protein